MRSRWTLQRQLYAGGRAANKGNGAFGRAEAALYAGHVAVSRIRSAAKHFRCRPPTRLDSTLGGATFAAGGRSIIELSSSRADSSPAAAAAAEWERDFDLWLIRALDLHNLNGGGDGRDFKLAISSRLRFLEFSAELSEKLRQPREPLRLITPREARVESIT